MRLRSLLFVPGDRPERMEKALSFDADALILDLEDSVSAGAKHTARMAVTALLTRQPRTKRLFVRMNPLDSRFAEADLTSVIPAAPDGIVLPKAEGAASLADLDQRLRALGDHTAMILPIATETPAAMFTLGTYGGVTRRLCGVTWGAEDLSAAIGAATNRDEDGRYTPPYEVARTLTLFGAHAAGVPAIETVFPNFHDPHGLAAYAARGRRDGFSGMMAIHPSQISVINAAFTPSETEIDHAKKIVDAFAANPEAGVLQLDGQMIDAPHLKLAIRILQGF
ncbi:MAG: CoA ester lyase [Acidocella sp.]|nr:CoA ester lyase [Acidocella sp.]